MNTVLLNTFSLDGETVIKKGSGGGGGGIPINNQSKSVEFTENGTSEVRYDAGYTGLEKVSVKVAIPTESKSVTITENGSSEVSASKGYLDKVSINVAIPTEEKTVDITENGTTEVVAANGFLSKVVVNTNVASGGGGGSVTPVSSGAITFRDYDGTPLHSYAKDEFLALAEMPELPTRAGLTCQGWNWSLEDAKAHVEANGRLNIGATYITDDGKTRLYIKVEGERKSFPIRFKFIEAGSLVIDWGDGATESISGSGTLNASHTYDAVGDYVISFEVAEGAILTLFGDSIHSMITLPYSIMLRKVEIGDRTNIDYGRAFFKCYLLSSIVIPYSVTSTGYYTFQYCYSLSSIVIPNSVTRIENYTFNDCYSLSSIVIPNSVTSIGNSAFQNCCSLSSIVIPNSVTRIENSAFQNCCSLAILDFRSHTFVPTLSNYNAFSAVASDLKIVVPDKLYDAWIAATNWSNSSVAGYIIKASEYNG